MISTRQLIAVPAIAVTTLIAATILTTTAFGEPPEQPSQETVVAASVREPVLASINASHEPGDPELGDLPGPAVEFMAAVEDIKRAEWYAGVLAEKHRKAQAAEAARLTEVAPIRQAPAEAAPVAVVTGSVWERLAQCESGMTNANTGNSYFGFFQFLPSTWRSVGGTGLPTDHGWDEQVKRAQILQARSGWGQWPACSRKLGLR